MSYVLKTNLSNSANYGSARAASTIKYIAIHYTGNDGDTDEGNASYFHSKIVKASAHYFVDDDSITQSVPDLRVAYSVGLGSMKAPNTSNGGGSYYGKCTNTNSISVELCDTKKNGKYDFTEATLANAAALVKTLMDKYGIPVTRVIRHFDVTGKICPAPMVNEFAQWVAFKNRITGVTSAPVPVQSETKGETKIDLTKIPYTGEATVLGAQKWLNTYFGLSLEEDGVYGSKTKAGLTKALQIVLGQGLVANGIFGKLTLAKCPTLTKSSTKKLTVTIWQFILICNKQNPNGVDGQYGNGCVNAQKAFEAAKKVTKNGTVEPSDWEKALK